jgi:hypothetical protein
MIKAIPLNFVPPQLYLTVFLQKLITRIHHRSDAFGLVADGGGSNALAVGLKWRF